MSDEQPAEQPAKPAEQPAKPAKQPAYKRGQLVAFVARDVVTGAQLDGIGVVTLGSDKGGHLVVRPLAAHDVTVDPAGVEPVVVDEV